MISIRKNNKGFTLVELLSIISLLSLISVIVVVVFGEVITNAKTNSYEVSLNEVQSGAVDYISENDNGKNWGDFVGDDVYKCVTIQNLIDKGFFDSDIIGTKYNDEGGVITADDKVLVVRNSDTKAIVLSQFAALNTMYGEYCSVDLAESEEVESSINFDITDRDTWKSSKKVEIAYELINVDTSSFGDYTYYYEITETGEIVYNNFSSSTEKVSLFVDSSMDVNNDGVVQIYAKIMKNDEIINNETRSIGKIDSISPVISLSFNDEIVKYEVTDELSGLKYGTYELDYLLTTENIDSCDALKTVSSSKTISLVVDSNREIGTIDLSNAEGGDYKLYVCSKNLEDNADNNSDDLVSIDVSILDDGPEFSRGDYECNQTISSAAIFSSKSGDMASFVSNTMSLLSSGTEFCYLKHEYVNLVGADENSWSSDWPFVSAYVRKDKVNSSNIPSKNLEVVDGVEYVFGYIPLQNGTMCLTSLPCPGMAQFGFPE